MNLPEGRLVYVVEMTVDLDHLPDDLALLKELVREMAGAIQALEKRNQALEHQLDRLRRHQFGRKSEKIDPRQLLLAFAQLEDEPEPPPPPEPPPKRRKKGHGRKPLPEDLPRERTEHDLAPEAKRCEKCGNPMEKIGEEVTRQLDYVPASFVVREHVRLKYACKACEESVALAPLPPQPIEKGLPGAGLLAHVLVSKYADHRVQGKLRSRWEKASRGRVAGPGHKPARTAAVKSRRGKRRATRRDVITSGAIREVERK